jgi:hypothetical protein
MGLPRYENIDQLPNFALEMQNIIMEVVQLGDLEMLQQIFELFYQYNLINPLYLAWIYSVQELVRFEVQQIVLAGTPTAI